MVQEQQGRIEVSSEHGKGSEFQILLPGLTREALTREA
jgi:chemotaxis protein histidine kinase CheA